MPRDNIAIYTRDSNAYTEDYHQILSVPEENGRDFSIKLGKERQTKWYQKALDWFLRDEDTTAQIKRAKVQFLEAIEVNYCPQAYEAVKALMKSHLGGVRTSSPLTNRFARECTDLAEKVGWEMLENLKGSLNKPLPKSFTFKVNNEWGTWRQFIENKLDVVISSLEKSTAPEILNWLKQREHKEALIKSLWGQALSVIAQKKKWLRNAKVEDLLSTTLQQKVEEFLEDKVRWGNKVQKLANEANEEEAFSQLKPEAMDVLLTGLYGVNLNEEDKNLLAVSVFFVLQRAIFNEQKIKPGDRFSILAGSFSQLVKQIVNQRGVKPDKDAIEFDVNEEVDKICKRFDQHKQTQKVQKSVPEKIFSKGVQGAITKSVNEALEAQCKAWADIYLSENVRQKGVKEFNGNQQVLAVIRSHMYSMRDQLVQQVSDQVLRDNIRVLHPPTYQELQEDTADAVKSIFARECVEPFNALLQDLKLPQNVEVVEDAEEVVEDVKEEEKRIYTESQFVHASREEIEILRQTIKDIHNLREDAWKPRETMVSHVFAITKHLLGPQISDTPNSYPWDDLSSQERESLFATCFGRRMLARVEQEQWAWPNRPLSKIVENQIRNAWKIRKELLAKEVIFLKHPQEITYFTRQLFAIQNNIFFTLPENRYPTSTELGDFVLALFAEVYKTFGETSEKEKMAWCKAALTVNNFVLFRKSRIQHPSPQNNEIVVIGGNDEEGSEDRETLLSQFQEAVTNCRLPITPSREDIVNSSRAHHGLLAHYQYRLQALIREVDKSVSDLDERCIATEDKYIDRKIFKNLLTDIEIFKEDLKQYFTQREFSSLYASTYFLEKRVSKIDAFMEEYVVGNKLEEDSKDNKRPVFGQKLEDILDDNLSVVSQEEFSVDGDVDVEEAPKVNASGNPVGRVEGNGDGVLGDNSNVNRDENLVLPPDVISGENK